MPLLLWVNLPVVDTITTQKDKFVAGVKIKATDRSNLNDSPDYMIELYRNCFKIFYLSVGLNLHHFASGVFIY